MSFIYNPDQMYIIEIKKAHLMLIAQLLHMHLAIGPKVIGEELLQSLRLQTDCVSDIPADHKVYSASTAPINATCTDPIWCVPYDKLSFE